MRGYIRVTGAPIASTRRLLRALVSEIVEFSELRGRASLAIAAGAPIVKRPEGLPNVLPTIALDPPETPPSEGSAGALGGRISSYCVLRDRNS
jgi:hypothetical protein